MKRIFLLLFVVISLPIYGQNNYVLVKEFYNHDAAIESVVLSPDGKTLVTGDANGYLFFWDIYTMELLNQVKAHRNRINSILFNTSGTKLVTCAEDATVKLWDFDTRKQLMSCHTAFDVVAFAVLSHDDSKIFFGGYPSHYSDNESYAQNGLYEVSTTGAPIPRLLAKKYFTVDFTTFKDYGITDGNIDVSGKYIVFTKGSNTYFWGIESESMEYSIGTRYSLNNLIPTDEYIYVWGDGYLFKLDNKNNYKITGFMDVTAVSNPQYSKVTVSEDKKLVVTGFDGSNVHIWNADDLSKRQTLSAHTSSVITFTFARNDSLLISGGYDGTLIVWGYPAIRDSLPLPKDSLEEDEEVTFAENNIPVSINGRDVELQSNITVHEPEFDIEIWDQSVVDGDSISLNLNGEWLLKDYAVVKKKLRVHVKINKLSTNNYLILYAHNLGEISPNTAAVQVLIDEKEYKLTLTSDLNKSGALNFSYEPK